MLSLVVPPLVVPPLVVRSLVVLSLVVLSLVVLPLEPSVAMKLCESDGPLAALVVSAACLTWSSSWSALSVSYGLWSDRLYAVLHWSLVCPSCCATCQ